MIDYIIISVIFVAIYLFPSLIKSSSSKLKEYKTISNLAIVISFVILLTLAFSYNENKSEKNNPTSTVADGFTIEGFNIYLDVHENNIVDVKEEIAINFYEQGHHGIYRFVPEWLEYTAKDGNTVSRKSTIKNLRAVGDPYTIDTVNGKKRVKIGSANYILSTGTKVYTIEYQYNMGKDPYEGFDEFIFHLFGDYWGTPIRDAYMEIKMPKDIEKDNIKFFTDKYRKNDITDKLIYEVDGNVLRAKLSDYTLSSALTMDIELPDGYFTNPGDNYGYRSLTLCIVIIALTVFVFLKWYFYGKDNNKYVETVEFYPPDDMDAAQIGYAYQRDTGKNLTVALIVELASKGFIKIEESEDKMTRTIYNLHKNNEDIEKLTENEKIVFDNLFVGGNSIVLSQDTSFYRTISSISSNVQSQLEEKLEDKESYESMCICGILLLVSTICFRLAFKTFKDMNPKLNFLYLISFICLFVIFVLVILMKRRTNYGEQIIAKVNGFKNFLETAEKYQIDNMVEQYPNYFYDILPFAYVLGVSKKWIEKFENIPEPLYEMGNFNYLDTSSYYNLSDSIHYPASSGSGSSSSGSSCGGGCSSCGGGCSSCGGGGSW